MRETAEDLERLQELLDVSSGRSGEAFIAHGTFVEVDEHHPMVELFDRTSRELGGTGYVEPRVLFAKSAAP